MRYRVRRTDGQVVEIDSPSRLPDPGQIASIEEPVITATILTGDEFVGGILKLCQDKRGIQKGIHYITTTRVMIQYELPLAEILLDFYDKLKSASRGYASLDYEITGHWVSPLVKLDVLVNGDPVDALSLIVHQETAYSRRLSRRPAGSRMDALGRSGARARGGVRWVSWTKSSSRRAGDRPPAAGHRLGVSARSPISS